MAGTIYLNPSSQSTDQMERAEGNSKMDLVVSPPNGGKCSNPFGQNLQNYTNYNSCANYHFCTILGLITVFFL